MKRDIRLVCFAALCAILVIALAGCQARSEGASNTEPVKPTAPAQKIDTDIVALDPAMIPNLKVEEVREMRLPRMFTATGKIQFNEDLTARVLAPLAGQV